MMVQWLRSLDAKLEAHGSNPSQGIEKEKKSVSSHHYVVCDGTLAFSLQKGGIYSLDWTTGLDHWTGLLDSRPHPLILFYLKI